MNIIFSNSMVDIMTGIILLVVVLMVGLFWYYSNKSYTKYFIGSVSLFAVLIILFLK